MSARDVLAKAIYDNDCLIAAKIADDGMPLVSWEQFKRDNPESAAVTTTFAGVYLSALRAAGWEVVPQRATVEMETACIKASLAFLIAHKIKAIWPWTRNRSHVRGNIQACWTAMVTAAQETTDGP